MKKRNFLIVFLVCFMVCASFSFFACKKSGDANEVYARVDSVMSEIKDPTEEVKKVIVFKQNIDTPFELDGFYHLDKDGKEQEDDFVYVDLTTIAFEYIDNYYLKIKDYQSGDFSDVHENIDKLFDSYNILKDEAVNLIWTKQGSIEIYNSSFLKYKYLVKNMILNAFDTATSMYIALNNAGCFNGLGTKEDSSDKFEFYVDSQVMLLANDYCDLFMKSCGGQDFANQEIGIGIAESILYKSVFASRFMTFNNKIKEYDFTANAIELTEIQLFMEKCGYLNNEREMVKKALEKYSLYQYVTKYEDDLGAYKVDLPEVEVYRNQVKNYFDIKCIVSNFVDYFLPQA